MRVQLAVGYRSIDLETTEVIPSRQDQMFFDLLKKALEALGYDELEILVYLTGANKSPEKEIK